GYPITPSSEIAEKMAELLPKADGTFIQMEDEIASMAAVIGASMGGEMAMTATSGPGFSLKQENLGYAGLAEVPCVVVDVMRGGPSTGMPTRPAQGDIMQARWGTHGDHPIIVLAPGSAQEIHDETIRAFALSERLRVPVVVLYDEVLGHLLESVSMAEDAQVTRRIWASGAAEDYRPYATDDDLIPAMALPGEGFRAHTTGLTHGEDGFPTQEPAEADAATRRLLDKLDRHAESVESVDCESVEDAEILVVAIGIVGRAARRAVREAREDGIRAGLFRPVTLWPFPERAFAEAVDGARAVLVPEMNAGQLRLEIERLAPDGVTVSGLERLDGEAVEPQAITDALAALAKGGPS
ncbi:MAG: 2-oxoacid:acceptor oxidoreductase subunit alpha, partial [Alphaproteobacteria bacterium]|nr:2-oxoacid:acceptor oxidoreductase subunit alpha [Alphaproteobacteria bacterium]